MRITEFTKSNILITCCSLLGVAVNFISQVLIAYYFGAQAERDAYFSAISVPTYLVALFVGSFSVVFLPFYVSFQKNNSAEELQKFVSSMFGLVTIFLFALAIAAFFFSTQIVHTVAPGFDQDQLNLTSKLFRILIFSMVFQSLSSFITVFHHADRRFIWPAVSPIVLPFTAMLFVAIFHDRGIVCLAYGTLAGSAIAMFLVLPSALRQFRIGYVTQLFNKHALRVVAMASPLFLSGIVYRLTPIIERVFASRLPAGSISYLGYSNQLYLLMATIASGSIVTTFYPVMAAAWAEEKKDEFEELLWRGIRVILLITLPIAALFIILGDPIIEILFERGAFDKHATQAVAGSLAILMGAFVSGSLGNMLMKVFYIAGRTTIISLINIAELIIYIFLAWFLSGFYSYKGLAFALTLSTTFTILVSIVFLLRWNCISKHRFSNELVKLFSAAAGCGLVAYSVYRLLSGQHVFVATAISGLSAVIAYIVIVFRVLRIKGFNFNYRSLKLFS